MTETEYIRTANVHKIKDALQILGSIMHGEQYGISKGEELTKAFRLLDKLQMSIDLEIEEDEQK